MQVTNNAPITPPPGTPVARPVARPVVRPVAPVDPVADARPRGEPKEKVLERALVEAAGLKLADVGKVRVALTVDEDANRVIAMVYDKETGELVRQIPTDEVLRNAALIRELLGESLNTVA